MPRPAPERSARMTSWFLVSLHCRCPARGRRPVRLQTPGQRPGSPPGWGSRSRFGRFGRGCWRCRGFWRAWRVGQLGGDLVVSVNDATFQDIATTSLRVPIVVALVCAAGSDGLLRRRHADVARDNGADSRWRRSTWTPAPGCCGPSRSSRCRPPSAPLSKGSRCRCSSERYRRRRSSRIDDLLKGRADGRHGSGLGRGRRAGSRRGRRRRRQC